MTLGNETFTAWENIRGMGVGVVIVPVLGVIETIAIGKAFGRKHNYNIDPNQELLAIGFSNILGSFVQSYPVTASFSRSAVNAQSGVRTPAGGIYTGSLVLLALALLTKVFYYIPDAGLAAVIIMAVTDMIDFSMVKKLWITKKSDLLPWFTAFFVSLLLGFEYGIMMGVAVSLLLLFYTWIRMKRETVKNEPAEPLLETVTVPPECAVVNVPRVLMFPYIEHLQDKVLEAAFSESEAKSILLNFKYVYDADYTAVQGVQELRDLFEKRKTQLILCHVQPHIVQTFSNGKVKNLQYADSLEDGIRMLSGFKVQAKETLSDEGADREPDAGEQDPTEVANITEEQEQEYDEDRNGRNTVESKSRMLSDGSIVIELASEDASNTK